MRSYVLEQVMEPSARGQCDAHTPQRLARQEDLSSLRLTCTSRCRNAQVFLSHLTPYLKTSCNPSEGEKSAF